jgi:hypothetical protein
MFYERGCQDKYLSLGRPLGLHIAVTASPILRRGDLLSQHYERSMAAHHNVGVVRETEKRHGSINCRPQFYLSLRGLMLFQVVRGRIESTSGLRPKSWTIIAHDPHPRPYTFRVHRRRTVEIIVLPANRSERSMLLPSSVSLDRTSLLSSKFVMQSPRSYAPGSTAPSRHACRSCVKLQCSCGTVRFDCRRLRRR